jgi:HAD superfamily hydrolase (TIGR01509 family)
MMLSRQAGAPTLEGVPIRALLFDFDGTIVDTEGPAFRAWYETFEEHGHELLLRDWSAAVGTVGGYLDPKSVRDAVRRRHLELVELEALRPGIADYVAAAQALRIQIAVVTSATTEWVTGMLDRLALAEGWHSFHAAEGDATIAKPRPDLYVRALQALDIEPREAIAIEDSPNGVRAAKAAGILCVAVPNDITRGLELSEADLILESLADVPLTELLTWAPTRASAQ